MNGQMKWGIRKKLFIIILIVLCINVVVLLFMGSALFESLYQYSKISELKSSALRIKSVYEQNPTNIYDELYELEGKNSMANLLSISEDGSSFTVEYSSRTIHNGFFPALDMKPIARPFADKNLLTRMKELDDKTTLTNSDSDRSRILYLLTKLDDNLYLYIETPKEYIKSIADLAVKYTALLSIFTLLIGSFLIYFMVGRVTKPIQNVQQVADKLSGLDFSQQCTVRGNDEIALLAHSVNNMSQQLQANISKLVEANAVLQNDLERQQQIDKMRKEFIANVSHDFKTPLTLIISYAEALRDDGGAADTKDYADIIIDEGNKMSSLVARLLKLSQLESGVEKLKRDNFCLSDVVDEVVKNHKLITQKKNLTVQSLTGEPYIVNADYQKLSQVFINLFENAIKYTPPGGKITISARQNDNKCVVSVFNTGSTIPAEETENIFLSFYRVDKVRARDMQSYGLGLAIVKTIMDMHNGRYGVMNLPDGVDFWVALDLADIDTHGAVSDTF